MSITIEREAADLITVRVSGKLSSSEWLTMQQDVAGRLRSDQLTSFLIVLDGFEGWERGNWEDMSFQLEHDKQIARMGIVADKKWKDEALLFAGKGFRKFDIRYFEPGELAQARAWLTSAK